MVRVIQPRIAVETGVANGISSCFILQAMEDNGEGRLYSIDVPAFITKPGGESGWLIPDWLRDRWDLTLGRSAEKLVPLLKRIGPIDLFISDSAHYYENEMFEFTAAWPFLANGGVLGCDDVTHCVALQDFSQGVGLNMVRFDGPRYAMGFINKDA